MRSVKAERKSRRSTRSQSDRRGQTGARASVGRIALGKKAAVRDGVLSRVGSSLVGILIRRPVLYLAGFLVAASMLAALFAGGYVSGARKSIDDFVNAAVTDAGFGISSVRLSGNMRTPAAAILAALGFEPDQSIFDADIQSARTRLLALDWVADAEVRRQYPNLIAVSIVEKLPFALWQNDKGLFVVERSGRVITRARASDYPNLPFFLGDSAPVSGAELVDAIAQHRAVAARIKAMQRVSERRWNLLLDDGVVVKLPETDWAKQLDVLEHLIVDKGILERDITEIDLRSPDNFFFRLRNGDSQQTTRENST